MPSYVINDNDSVSRRKFLYCIFFSW